MMTTNRRMMKMDSTETMRTIPMMEVNRIQTYFFLCQIVCNNLVFIKFVDWTNDDDRLLVERIKATLKENDNVNFKTRLKKIDWKQIAFKKYSASNCEDRFETHVKRVRRFRILKEIVVDVEENIKKARAGEGLSAYHVFVQEQLSKATSSADFVSFLNVLRIDTHAKYF